MRNSTGNKSYLRAVIQGHHESKFVYIEETESILSCVRIFQNRNIGAMLVLGGYQKSELVGIITERDILKNVLKLTEPGALSQPVRSFMTINPITLPIGKIDKAAESMIKHGFRHMIFTLESESNSTTIAGIISMRDIFKDYVLGSKSKLAPFLNIQTNALLVSTSDDSRKMFRSVFSKIKSSKLKITELNDNNLLNTLCSFDHLFLDLGHDRPEEWSAKLKEILALSNKPKKITIILNPNALFQKTLNILEQISKGGLFVIMEKPLDLSIILEQLKNDKN